MGLFDNFADNEIVVISQNEISRKARVVIDELNAKSLERDEMSRMITLAFLSSKHVFLIGKPGVGKTFVASKLKYLLKDGKVFEYLLAHDTEPEEIYGHNFVDKDGKVHHAVERSIVNANIIFLDEMFKAKSGLLNGMLGALSQSRNFFLRDIGEIKLDLICAFVTSNEFPTDEVLDPFDDRLHFRYEVVRLKENESFRKMVTKDYDTTNEFSVGFSYDEIVALSKEYQKINFDDDVLNFFVELKNNIVRNELNISDRKLDDAVDVFRASAYLNGRSEINYSDMFILMHMGWRDFVERRKLKQIIFDTFFQKKEDIEKNLITMDERLKKIISYGTVNVEPFITDKIIFDMEDNNEIAKYNQYVDFYISLLSALQDLQKEISRAEDKYYFTVSVEEMIVDNIFIIDYTNTSFTEEYLVGFYELNKSFNKVYDYYFKYVSEKAKKIEVN